MIKPRPRCKASRCSRRINLWPDGRFCSHWSFPFVFWMHRTSMLYFLQSVVRLCLRDVTVKPRTFHVPIVSCHGRCWVVWMWGLDILGQVEGFCFYHSLQMRLSARSPWWYLAAPRCSQGGSCTLRKSPFRNILSYIVTANLLHCT